MSNKLKSAMKELIAEMESLINTPYINPKNALTDCINLAYNKLQLEREQIEKSYIKGREDWQKYGFSHYNYEKDMEIPTPRKYYNETYGGQDEK